MEIVYGIKGIKNFVNAHYFIYLLYKMLQNNKKKSYEKTRFSDLQEI